MDLAQWEMNPFRGYCVACRCRVTVMCLYVQVKKLCGQPRLVAGVVEPDARLSAPGASVELPGVTVSSVARGYREHVDSPLSTQLELFLQAVSSTHAISFYADLADSLCSDPSFAETRDTADCWNGLRVGE